MKQNQRWIILFALVVLAYGISQYWNQQRSPTFRAVLIDFLPRDVERIDIEKAQQPRFSILKQDQRWLITAPNISEEAQPEAVTQLLKRLQAIRTEAIVAQSASEWETYGLDDDQGVLICLTYMGGEQDCVRVGRYIYASQHKRLELYARLASQEEIYIIDGLALSFLDGEADFFRNHQLLRITDTVQRLSLQLKNKQIEVKRITDTSWIVDDKIMNTLHWTPYVQQTQNLDGKSLTDDIDELSLDSLLVWQLQLFTDKDSFLLKCFIDSTKQPPYILHSNQFRKTWISTDSTGLINRLLAPWQKWLANE